MFGVVGVHDAGTTRPCVHVAVGACDWRVGSFGRALESRQACGLDCRTGVMRRRATKTRQHHWRHGQHRPHMNWQRQRGTTSQTLASQSRILAVDGGYLAMLRLGWGGRTSGERCRDVSACRVHVECIHNTRSFRVGESSGASPKAEQRAATRNRSNALNARRPAGQLWWGKAERR
jgi:hypothetical protein